VVSAVGAGIRLGRVSELSLFVPLAPGGVQRLRAFLRLNGNLDGANKVGTVHDMRFVFLENDTKLLFATAYDGDWDVYIDDFVAKIPDYLDIISSAFEGWAGHPKPGGEGLLLEVPGHCRRVVRRESGSHGSGDAEAQAHRPCARRVPRQGRRLGTAMTVTGRLGSTLPRGGVTVELDDIQATVLRYRPEPYYGTHVMLQVEDARAGRQFCAI
jgi:hypothetical protein